MGKSSQMILHSLIRFNNRLTRWRRIRTEPCRLLLLAPHCLQNSSCGRNLTRVDGEGCARCGKCEVGALQELAERTGIKICVAGGGRQALAAIKAGPIDVIVAVACEKELMQGILAVFPKPVLAVCNTRPQGDCHDTRVAVAAVETAVRSLTEAVSKKQERVAAKSA